MELHGMGFDSKYDVEWKQFRALYWGFRGFRDELEFNTIKGRIYALHSDESHAPLQTSHMSKILKNKSHPLTKNNGFNNYYQLAKKFNTWPYIYMYIMCIYLYVYMRVWNYCIWVDNSSKLRELAAKK